MREWLWDVAVRGRRGALQIECAQRPPNFIMISCRRPGNGFSSRVPLGGSMKGVPSCNLDGGLETPYLQAPVKNPIEELLPLSRGRYRRRSGRSSWHVTASLTQIHYPATTSRPSRRGRPTRPHGPPRRSGAHPQRHHLEQSPTSPCRPRSLELRGRQICLQRAGGRGIWVCAARG